MTDDPKRQKSSSSSEESRRRLLLLCNTASGISSLSISACVAVTSSLPPVGLDHGDVVSVELKREVVFDVVVVVIALEWQLRRLLTRSMVILRTAVHTGPDLAATCCSAAIILAAKSASVISFDSLADVNGILNVDLNCFNCQVRGVRVE